MSALVLSLLIKNNTIRSQSLMEVFISGDSIQTRFCSYRRNCSGEFKPFIRNLKIHLYPLETGDCCTNVHTLTNLWHTTSNEDASIPELFRFPKKCKNVQAHTMPSVVTNLPRYYLACFQRIKIYDDFFKLK